MAELDLLGECTEESCRVAAEWLQSVRHKIRLEAFEKSEQYCYDFERDQPVSKPDGVFQWEVDDEKPLPKRSLQRSSLSTITSLTSEHESCIPPIPQTASRLSFGRPSAV